MIVDDEFIEKVRYDDRIEVNWEEMLFPDLVRAIINIYEEEQSK